MNEDEDINPTMFDDVPFEVTSGVLPATTELSEPIVMLTSHNDLLFRSDCRLIGLTVPQARALAMELILRSHEAQTTGWMFDFKMLLANRAGTLRFCRELFHSRIARILLLETCHVSTNRNRLFRS